MAHLVQSDFLYPGHNRRILGFQGQDRFEGPASLILGAYCFGGLDIKALIFIGLGGKD